MTLSDFVNRPEPDMLIFGQDECRRVVSVCRSQLGSSAPIISVTYIRKRYEFCDGQHLRRPPQGSRTRTVPIDKWKEWAREGELSQYSRKVMAI